MTGKSVPVTPAVQSLDRGLSILEVVGQSSVPVILASVGISAPRTRFPKKRFATVGRQVSATAKAITCALAS